MENKSNDLEQQPELTSSEPAESTPSNEYQPVLDQYAANTEPVEMPPVIEDPPQPAPQNITNYDLPVAPKSSFFKILFTIALIIFIIVIAVLGFTYFKNKKTNNSSSSIFDTVKISPTEVPTITCFLNDKTYRAGESFPSADGCNTCSCTSDSNIVCTEKACAPTPTTVATKSATKTPSTFVAPKITPDKVTLTFYQNYIKSGEGVKGYKNSPYLTEKFMTELDKAYSEMDKNGGLGADIILMAQDVPNTFKANIIKQDNTSATVSLTESNGWSQNLIISLVIVDNQWKIDSVALNK